MHRKKRPTFVLIISMILGSLGCSEQPMAQTYNESSGSAVAARAAPEALATPSSGMMGMYGGDATKAPAVDDLQKSALTDRKIIYNANIEVVTENLTTLEANLNKLVAAQKGYVADSDRTGSAGSSRHGTWKVRIPTDSFEAFLRGAVALGELVSLKTDSQDVSEEFYDLDARQLAKKVEETRLLKHLTDSTGKLEDILAVERELSRVRSEIERMQGRLRVIANLTSLATVTLVAREIKDYKPPQAPTLSTRIARTFSASLESLKSFGENVLLVVVGLTPWLPVILIGAVVAYWLFRRLVRRINWKARI